MNIKTANELRSLFLKFFESKGHLRLGSFSLVPKNDNSLLLINSGMVVRDAWKRTAVTGNRQLYIEMQNTSLEIENGVMEIEAYRNFAERCGIKEARKFATLIIQNLTKGNEELAMFLGDLSDEMWEIKKNEVKQKGEKANSKLLLPVFIIFIGILILVLVPAMSSMG